MLATKFEDSTARRVMLGFWGPNSVERALVRVEERSYIMPRERIERVSIELLPRKVERRPYF